VILAGGPHSGEIRSAGPEERPALPIIVGNRKQKRGKQAMRQADSLGPSAKAGAA